MAGVRDDLDDSEQRQAANQTSITGPNSAPTLAGAAALEQEQASSTRAASGTT